MPRWWLCLKSVDDCRNNLTVWINQSTWQPLFWEVSNWLDKLRLPNIRSKKLHLDSTGAVFTGTHSWLAQTSASCLGTAPTLTRAATSASREKKLAEKMMVVRPTSRLSIWTQPLDSCAKQDKKSLICLNSDKLAEGVYSSRSENKLTQIKIPKNTLDSAVKPLR